MDAIFVVASPAMERLHILDGHGYIFRAYYGLAGGGANRHGVRLNTAEGMPTGALLVYAQMLIRLHLDDKPERIVVVFDAPGRNFRQELAADYKATRREMPADLKPQLPYFAKITKALSWPVLAVPGVEADDVIATLVRRAHERDWDVVIYSGDKDLMQLVGERVTVIDSLRNITYDAAAVTDKFGVSPAQMRDYLALVGDKSDNVPGVPGVGKVTAAKLLTTYGSIDNILAHVDDLKGKLKERFRDREALAQLERSQVLVTLKDDLDIDTSLDNTRPGPWDGAELTALFRKLEFESLLKRLDAAVPVPKGPPAGAGDSGAQRGANSATGGSAARDAIHERQGRQSGAIGADTETAAAEATGAATGAHADSATGAHAAPEWPAREERAEQPSRTTLSATVVALTEEDVRPVILAARAAKRVAVQVETDGERPDRARVIGLALAAPAQPPIYLPLAHRYLSAPAQWTALPDELVALLADPEVAVVGHDVKAMRRALISLGVDVAGIAGDTMLAAYLLGTEGDQSIAAVAADAAAIDVPLRKDLLGKGKSKIAFESVAVEVAAEAAGRATQAVLAAEPVLRQRLGKAGMDALLTDLELPLAVLLVDVEQHGITLDVPYLRRLSDKIGAQVADLERRVYELADEEFNLGSPKQLSRILFDKLALSSPKKRKTKTGGYSTNHEVLESLAQDHPSVPLIIEHRELVKLKNTYLDALPPLVNPKTGRIHTSFNQAVAATGRLSSQDPNLQNIPIRTDLGREIRRAFVAAAGQTLVSVDYSQIELRIMAHLSGDPVLVKAFRDGVDVHSQTAAEVFGMARDEVGPSERRVAKAVNYGLIYGQSDFGLAQALGISRAEARHYMERYFERFATVRTFMDQAVDSAGQIGAAVTLLGRRRPIADLGARSYQRRKAAERVAQNTPVQGSAADIIKLAMLRVAERMQRTDFAAKMLLTVHDELVFEVAPDRAEAFAAMVTEEMEAAYALDVPLTATAGIARNWADAH